MFTGLIQTTGAIRAMTSGEIQVAWGPSAPTTFLQGMALGDSIAVDGICLSVTQILSDSFWAAVSPETSQRTALGYLQANAVVNLESSLRVGSKIGGHFVTGHVDGVGYLDTSTQSANAWDMRFTVPDERVARYIVSKGSVAVNGISLTVADCASDGSWFTVAVIPITYADTNLQQLSPNSPVNLEGDVLGKYVEKFLGLRPNTASHGANNASSHTSTDRALESWAQMSTLVDPPGAIDETFLAEHGYG